jgi:hypothetical protein
MNADPTVIHRANRWPAATALLLAAVLVWPGVVPAETRPAAPAPAPSAPLDVIRFLNGDTLHAWLLSLAPEAGMRLRHPDVKAEIVFDSANLAEVVLGATRPRPAAAESARALVRLTNGDELVGEIVSADAHHVRLATAWAGAVPIKRSMVASIIPNERRLAPIYTGPTGLDDWTLLDNPRAWTHRHGAFYSTTSGSIGRDMNLPDVARIDFDVAWRGYPNFQVILYTNLAEGRQGGGYMVQFSGSSVYLQRGQGPRRGFSNLGSFVNLEAFQRKSRGRVTVLINKPQKTFALLADDELVRQWNDPDEFAGSGTAMYFYASSGQPIKISNISVSHWDGRLQTDAPAAEPGQDTVQFTNNDQAQGRLQAIAGQQLTFVTSYATLNIPLERAVQITLAPDKAERARRNAGDIRAHFADHGVVTVALETLDEHTLVGSSENFGRLSFNRQAFQRLQFRIYDRSLQPDPDEDW